MIQGQEGVTHSRETEPLTVYVLNTDRKQLFYLNFMFKIIANNNSEVAGYWSGCVTAIPTQFYTLALNLSSPCYIFQVRTSAGYYKMNVCGAVKDKGCKNSPVCLVSGDSSSSFGISKAMSLNYSWEQQAVIMQYGSGDPCPSGQSCICTAALIPVLLYIQRPLKLSPTCTAGSKVDLGWFCRCGKNECSFIFGTPRQKQLIWMIIGNQKIT